jgi:glycerophosphoryl diester phosphodiesterase
MKLQIITHRGLQPSRENHPFEQSLEALRYQSDQGWGLEFDPNFTKDSSVGKGIIIMHDTSLNRVTGGKDMRLVGNVPFVELTKLKLPGGFSVPSLDKVLELIESQSKVISAMHLKGIFQDETDNIDLILTHLKKHPDVVDRMMIFDVKPESARYLLEKNPALILAPSVAHEYDIERFNGLMKGTLITVEEALELGPQGEGLYKWIWGDEWDLIDSSGEPKQLYTRNFFDTMHDAGYLVAVVSPELHSTSPALNQGESHPDGVSKSTVLNRAREIISNGVDALCTDYPEELQTLINSSL